MKIRDWVKLVLIILKWGFKIQIKERKCRLLKIKDCYNNKVFFVNEKEIVKWIDKYFH